MVGELGTLDPYLLEPMVEAFGEEVRSASAPMHPLPSQVCKWRDARSAAIPRSQIAARY